jgi:coatomer protein complex subunit epsilon
MDPFSAEGELVNIHTAFIQGQYQLVLSDFDASDFSESNRLPIKILQYRAQCELGQASEVLSAVSNAQASSTPDLAAVRTYASFVKSGAQDEKAVAEAEKLSEAQGDNLTVQLLCGTVLARAGKQEQALQLLAKHQGSLDAVALIVQIHLSQNRTDLAVKEAKGARSFAQDALLVNLAESWIGIRQVCFIRAQARHLTIKLELTRNTTGRRELPEIFLRLRRARPGTLLRFRHLADRPGRVRAAHGTHRRGRNSSRPGFGS